MNQWRVGGQKTTNAVDKTMMFIVAFVGVRSGLRDEVGTHHHDMVGVRVKKAFGSAGNANEKREPTWHFILNVLPKSRLP